MNLHVLLPVILLPAKVFEVVMCRLHLPAVVGAILAGVVLGPVLLGILPLEAEDPAGYQMLHELSSIGLCVLLFRIGLETSFNDFIRVWKPAASIAAAGMVLPLLLGWSTGLLWGMSHQGALFIGAALTATSIGVTASVLSELLSQKSREGLYIIGAAILDDVMGLLLLSALVAFVTPTASVTSQVLTSMAQAIMFIAAGLILGPYIVQLIARLSSWSNSQGVLLVLAFSYFLLVAYGAKTIGLDMIIGAYAAGIAFSRHPERSQIERDLKPFTELLTPLFFVLLGASVEFSTLNPLTAAGRQSLMLTAVLLAVAVVGKLFSGFCLRGGQVNRWAIGSGMMPRGEVGFVFAQIGLLTGAFTHELFTTIVVVLVATTIIGPIMLRRSLQSS